MKMLVWTLFLGLNAIVGAASAEPTRVGHASYDFTDRTFAPVFERTMILGHSISADFLKGIVSLADGPATVLSRDYAGRACLANLAEPRRLNPFEFGSVIDPMDAAQARLCAEGEAALSPAERNMCEVLRSETKLERSYRKLRGRLHVSIALETGLAKIYRLNEQIDNPSARTRRLSFLNEMYDKSTAIVGIDAFYLSPTTGFNECAEVSVRDVLSIFLERSHRDGKVVILGNVPKEDYSTFSWFNKLTLNKQNESCRSEINEALKSECTAERGCYLVDLERMVADLNRDGFLELKDGTLLLSKPPRRRRNQVRPDGVNLSDRGVQYVVEEILRSLAANPPRALVPTRE